MKSFNELHDEIQRWGEIKGWTDFRSVGDSIALMHSELSEALEEYRNHHEPDEIYENDGKPEGVPIELADVIIRILHFSAHHQIDIEKALEIKMAYNYTRTYRHGGKRL